MNTHSRQTFLATLFYSALLVLGQAIVPLNAFAQTPANATGNWTIYSTDINNGETVVKHVQISQSGTQLSGYFEGPFQAGPIQGFVRGNHIEFSTVTRTVLTFRGEVLGDSMSGLYGIRAAGAFRIQRTC
jgi:hypothetical protein